MNFAEMASCEVIEQVLGGHTAYRKIEDRLYTVKQGSTFVMVNVVPWGEKRAVVRCAAQVVAGVRLAPELMRKLLEFNGVLRFGAFAFHPEGDLILFLHSILGGTTLDPEELSATVRAVALIADEYDDKIIARFGGKTMRELLEDNALARIFGVDPEALRWDS